MNNYWCVFEFLIEDKSTKADFNLVSTYLHTFMNKGKRGIEVLN